MIFAEYDVYSSLDVVLCTLQVLFDKTYSKVWWALGKLFFFSIAVLIKRALSSAVFKYSRFLVLQLLSTAAFRYCGL